MIFNIQQQIDYLEQVANITLREGDLLMTGTPEGILPVCEGDLIQAYLRSENKVIDSITERVGKEARPRQYC